MQAWEKRGYWVKADRFRMDWMWTGQFADKIKVAIFTDDWGAIAMTIPQIAQKLNKIELHKTTDWESRGWGLTSS